MYSRLLPPKTAFLRLSSLKTAQNATQNLAAEELFGFFRKREMLFDFLVSE